MEHGTRNEERTSTPEAIIVHPIASSKEDGRTGRERGDRTVHCPTVWVWNERGQRLEATAASSFVTSPLTSKRSHARLSVAEESEESHLE